MEENSLNLFLSRNNIQLKEGRINGQKPFLKKLFKNDPTIKNVLEVGFNAGHSSDFMLSLRDDIKVTSVDIGEHHYVTTCYDFVKNKYPNRFKIIIGDSKKVLFSMSSAPYDFIFIDGGHLGDVPYHDMINCRGLSHRDTIVMLDDCGHHFGYQQNIMKHLNRLVSEKFIATPKYFQSQSKKECWAVYKYV